MKKLLAILALGTICQISANADKLPSPFHINPTPHKIERPDTGYLNISKGFKINDKKKAFGNDLSFIKKNPSGTVIDIDYNAKTASASGIQPKEGAYSLNITPGKINILGYDKTGAFYGLQSLRMLLEENSDSIPLLMINDYPTLKHRGVVEGFYGNPWSHEVRLSLIDFYGKNKMNSYVYGPKDDPYHRSPNWREPYPEKEGKQIKELVDACRKNHVQFVWAIHPGVDIKWNQEDYNNLINKFEAMYKLGVRQFALFFDDISGEGTDSHKQVDLINNLTRDFIKKKKDVGNFLLCPTEYNESWANKTENGQLAIYGRELNPNVEVFWTGPIVCSNIMPSTMDFVNSRIKRPAIVWWNYPVTDYCRNSLVQGPVYGLDLSLGADDLVGIESNPMEQGEASKIALYGVADWAWNPTDFHSIDNWEHGLKYIMPEAADAYRTFAIHSCDTRIGGLRRQESWETETFPVNKYKQEQFDAMQQEFQKIKDAPAAIIAGCTNKGLVEEMKPWLVEFEKLGERGLKTMDLIKLYRSGAPDEEVWKALLEVDMTPLQRAEFEAHRSGTIKMQPFIDYSIDYIRRKLAQKGSSPSVPPTAE